MATTPKIAHAILRWRKNREKFLDDGRGGLNGYQRRLPESKQGGCRRQDLRSSRRPPPCLFLKRRALRRCRHLRNGHLLARVLHSLLFYKCQQTASSYRMYKLSRVSFVFLTGLSPDYDFFCATFYRSSPYTSLILFKTRPGVNGIS